MIHNFRETDRASAKQKLRLDNEALDSLHVITDGEQFATWVDVETKDGMIAMLGFIPQTGDVSKVWEFALEIIVQTQVAGYKRGFFEVHDPGLMALIDHTFSVYKQVITLKEGKPAGWKVEVDLADAERQVREALK